MLWISDIIYHIFIIILFEMLRISDICIIILLIVLHKNKDLHNLNVFLYFLLNITTILVPF